MKNSTLLILCTLFFSLFASAQTNITGSISTNTTFTTANSPYVIVNSIEVSPGITLTVQPGVTVKFNAGTYLHVRGTLNANGASFTGNAGVTKGFWDGIYVSYENYETGNVNLNKCTVEYASNLYVRKGQLTLHSCIVNNLSGTVRISSLGKLNIDSTKISNTNFPLTYYGTGTINPGNDIRLTDNTYNYVDIDFSEVTDLFWLKNFGYPYFNDNSIQVRAAGTLLIDPGVDLQIQNTEITVNGKIKAVGKKNNPIVFERTPTSSYWLGINILNSSVDSACVMRNCIFKNANYENESYCAIEIENASPVIDSCRFTGNVFNTKIYGDSKPVISNCVFGPSTRVNGEAYNVLMDMAASPVFTNDSLQFNNSEIQAIGLKGSTVTGHAQLKKLSFTGLNNISYCLYDNTVILDTASVVINPGVVIKCRDNNSLITANGSLTGIGTTAEPIIFTHIADDAYGNPADSQNNGTQTINASNGGRIDLASKSVSKLENWKFNYAGYNSSNWALYVRNDNVINNCEIKNSYNGIWFTKNAQITNNTFNTIPQYPIGYDLSTGTPNLQGNTLTNVGYIGIQLDGVESGSPTLKKMDFAGYTNLSYIMTHGITIANGNTLTINPGVVIKSQRYGHAWEINGAISAIGTKTEKIIFTSINDDSAWGDTNNNGTGSVPNNYDWYGFNFTGSANDTDNILRNCEIRYCGGGWDIDTPVQITDCHVLMDSVKINFTNQCGMSIYGSANPEIKDCEFYNILWEPIYMDMFANPAFTGTNKLANIGDISIKLRAGTVTGTVPVRSFAGYNPITYSWWDDALTVSDHLTIPAGLTFKGYGRWNITTGKLNILGTAANPVVFTTVEDDAYGNPKDSQQNGVTATSNNGPYFVFSDSSNDSSMIDHAIFRYNRTTPIQLNNASPTIQNCRFENYSPSYTGVSLVGKSSPSIDNCTFNNIGYPFNTSLLTYPRSTVGNVITGTTARAIRINDETLTQDATLAKRSFAGIANIPYVFNNYTVGTAAKLTIDPGVVSKFNSYGYLNISNGLKAVGGSSPDSVIVFTSDRDNFYGGNTHNNGDASTPWNYGWQGIYFTTEAIDETCVMKNCIIKYASYPDSRAAVTMDNASPTVRNCRFENDYYGIIAFNSISPVISDCDFINMDVSGYAIWNKSTNDITASNCWFNSNTGPRNTTSNPTGTGERVTDHVLFSPFVTQLNKAELGDVSLNGTINPYDASLILQYAVSNITLNPVQQKVADVSGNSSITSYDASLILQYNVGLTATFTPNPSLIRQYMPATEGLTNIAFASMQQTQNNDEFIIPVSLHTGTNIKSLDMKYTFNPNHIKLQSVSSSKLNPEITLVQTNQTDNGLLAVSLASAYDLALENEFVYLTFKVVNTGIAASELTLVSAIANESPVALNSPSVIVNSKLISSFKTIETDQFMNVWIGGDKMNVEYNTVLPVKTLKLQVTDITGRTVYNRQFIDPGKGRQVLQIPLSEMGSIQKGVYVIQINVDSRNFSKKLVVNW